jgi:hypothetical protein
MAEICPRQNVMNLKVKLSLTFLLLWNGLCFGQDDPGMSSNRISPREFAIPVSPVFDLMGMVPAQVSRTDEIRDFKVDWSFRSWTLSPNLAIQSKPIWEIFYNRKSLDKYQRAPWIMHRLASLDVSLGTAQTPDLDRQVGFAVKINLFKGKDPLLAKDIYADIQERFDSEKDEITKHLNEVNLMLDTTSNILTKFTLKQEKKNTEEQLFTINQRRQQEINERARIFSAEHWNSPSVDLAVGKVYSYIIDSTGAIDQLRFNRNTALGVWVNASYGIGRKILVSGLVRASFYDETLRFLLSDDNTGQILDRTAVASNQLFTLGLNIRYGGPKFSFFAELIHERRGTSTPIRALRRVFEIPKGFTLDESSVKWTGLRPFSINLGGDWRLNRNVVLNYGVRLLADKDFKIVSVVPVVAIGCLMR